MLMAYIFYMGMEPYVIMEWVMGKRKSVKYASGLTQILQL